VTSKTGSHPSVVFETLSPSTSKYEQSYKATRYCEIEAVRLVVLVDPVARTFETYERFDADSWQVGRHRVGAALELAEPEVTLTAEEMFAEGLRASRSFGTTLANIHAEPVEA
jgi:Uma2 family endonuclease